MVHLRKFLGRRTQGFTFESRPNLLPLRAAVSRAVGGLLSAEDSEHKKAVLFRGSVWLARALGLEKAQRLILDYPDFTLENLALLGGEYDFIVTDRVLHLCASLHDAGSETMRVLRPGGWFVHTTCLFDFASRLPLNARRASPSTLSHLFPHATGVRTGTWGSGGRLTTDAAIATWVVGRKAENPPAIAPTVKSRMAKPSWYRFLPRPAKFGVVAAVRNEAPYLLEWIAHYRLLGFDQITIYDNQSNDASSRILGPLSAARVINAVYWTDQPHKQERAYDNARRRLSPFVEWCLFVDLDEFLVLDPGFSLDDILPKQPDISAIGIPWRIYGSGGQRNRRTEPVIERFTSAGFANDCHVKSLVRLRDLRDMGIHMPRRIAGRVVDIGGSAIDVKSLGLLRQAAFGPARINHYFNRSWEEFECKRARGRGDIVGGFHSEKAFDKHDPGDIELRDALKYVPGIKEEVARLRRMIGGSRQEK